MGKIAAISVLVVLFGITGADADIVELDLFDLGCQTLYDPSSPYWSTDFDLGVTFIEISNVYIDWAGEIAAGLAIDYRNPGEIFPEDVGISAAIGLSLSFRHTGVLERGKATYPDPEPFDYRSEFVYGTMPWSELLDGRGTIWIKYHEIIMVGGTYIESGSIVLNEGRLIVEGVIPEPATGLLLGIGIILVRASKVRMSRYVRK